MELPNYYVYLHCLYALRIFVEKLPKHPQYKQATPEDLKDTKKVRFSLGVNPEHWSQAREEVFSQACKWYYTKVMASVALVLAYQIVQWKCPF